MLYATLKAFHLLSIIVWVGGMSFAHFFLRPALTALEAPARVILMHAVLERFFNTVLYMTAIALFSGVWMLLLFSNRGSDPGAYLKMPMGWMVMAALGTLMVAVFGHIRFVLFKRLHNAVLAEKWAVGAAALASIRSWVRINLGLSLIHI